MKSRYLTPSLLLAGFVALANPVASASDELAGALVGAGAGALIGHAVGGSDAAVFGGFVGAMLGAAAADDDDRHDYKRYGPRPDVRYRPAPPRYYAPPPFHGKPRYAAPGWRHDRHHGRDMWRERDHDRYHDRDRDRDDRARRDYGQGHDFIW